MTAFIVAAPGAVSAAVVATAAFSAATANVATTRLKPLYLPHFNLEVWPHHPERASLMWPSSNFSLSTLWFDVRNQQALLTVLVQLQPTPGHVASTHG